MALKYLYVPSGYKGGGSSGTAYGVLPNVANADFALVRTTTATRINADGLIETMGANVPRLDYTNGSCPTLLTEPESKNLVQYSENFSQWEERNLATATLDASATNPKGELGAYIVSNADGANIPDNIVNLIINTSVSTTYTESIYVKSLGATEMDIRMRDNSTGSSPLFNHQFTTSGWERISLTSATGSSTTSIRFILGGSDGDFLVWGAQLEEQPYATSYIYNNGTALGVTRSADTGVISGDLSSYLNSSEGVLEIKAKALFNGGSSVRIAVSNGTADNRINLIWASSSNTMQLGIKSNGNNVLDGGNTFFESFTHDQTQMATFKIKWKSGDIQVKMNEEVVITDTSSFSGLVLNRLRLDAGYGSASNLFEGNVQYIKVYDSVTDF
jgi:hypothetical protein